MADSGSFSEPPTKKAKKEPAEEKDNNSSGASPAGAPSPFELRLKALLKGLAVPPMPENDLEQGEQQPKTYPPGTWRDRFRQTGRDILTRKLAEQLTLHLKGTEGATESKLVEAARHMESHAYDRQYVLLVAEKLVRTKTLLTTQNQAPPADNTTTPHAPALLNAAVPGLGNDQGELQPKAYPPGTWRDYILLGHRNALARRIMEKLKGCFYGTEIDVVGESRLVDAARQIESHLYDVAESQDQYYFLLAEKMYRIYRVANTGGVKIKILPSNSARNLPHPHAAPAAVTHHRRHNDFLGRITNKLVNFDLSQRSNGYDWATTADDVAGREGVDMRGKTVMVTGGYSGIGREMTRVLYGLGANIILAGRSPEPMEAWANQLRAMGHGGSVRCVALDLCSLRSVRQCAHEINQSGGPIHVLVCNAGVFAVPYQETEDGFESQFQTHHLGHFLLTSLLVPRLVEAQPSRVVLVASIAHHLGAPDINDINGKNTWYRGGPIGRWLGYGRSKSAMVLFAQQLTARMHELGLHISANACHPGTQPTPIVRNLSWPEYLTMTPALKVFGKTPVQGAATPVYLSISEAIRDISGKYFSDCNLARPASHATDPNLARQLWEFSEKATKVKFGISEEAPGEEAIAG